jgi:hypothetical protein
MEALIRGTLPLSDQLAHHFFWALTQSIRHWLQKTCLRGSERMQAGQDGWPHSNGVAGGAHAALSMQRIRWAPPLPSPAWRRGHVLHLLEADGALAGLLLGRGRPRRWCPRRERCDRGRLGQRWPRPLDSSWPHDAARLGHHHHHFVIVIISEREVYVSPETSSSAVPPSRTGCCEQEAAADASESSPGASEAPCMQAGELTTRVGPSWRISPARPRVLRRHTARSM